MRYRLLLIALLVFVQSAFGQQSEQVTLTFDHLALSVKDIDLSADFYSQVLNLSELSRGEHSIGVRWFSLGEGKELHLISHEYFKGDKVQINKAVHLALATNRFDDLLKFLDSKDIAYGDWEGTPKAVEMRSDGVRQVFLKDPDGYWIEINSVGGK